MEMIYNKIGQYLTKGMEEFIFMTRKLKRNVILTVCVVSLLYSTTVLAATRTVNKSNSSKTLSLVSTVIYDNATKGTYMDFVGYGASVGGQDVKKVTEANKGTLSITYKNGVITTSAGGNFYYAKALSGSKMIATSNTKIDVKVQVDSIKEAYTLK